MEIEPFSLTLSSPLKTASGTIETRDGFLVRVRIDGTEGLGEATPLSGWTEPLEVCERTLREIDNPQSALTDDSLLETPAARHGLELAVFDSLTRATGQPLYRFLGGPNRCENVPVNATVGDGTPAEAVTAAENASNAGFQAVKLKVGAQSPQTDLERIEAIRGRCPDIELRVDANGAWTYDTARRLLPILSELDVSVAEQPLSAGELSKHARLRGHGVDIAIDEGVIEHGHEAVMDANAADLLICKPMALGGVHRTREIIETARARSMDAIVTTTIDGAIARVAAVHLAASVPDIRPCGLATADMLNADLIEGVTPVTNGSISVPQGKGNITRR